MGTLRTSHQKPRRRCAEPVGAISSLRDRPSSAGEARDALRPSIPTFKAALGGARLDPSNRLTLPEAFCPFEDRPSGEQGSTRPVSPSREAVRGAGLNPMRPVPGSETEPPGFSAGNPGKPDTDSIVSGPRSETEGLRRPGAQSVHFSLRLAAGRCHRPGGARIGRCPVPRSRGQASIGCQHNLETQPEPREYLCLVSETPYMTP